jgi:hypothetical protein
MRPKPLLFDLAPLVSYARVDLSPNSNIPPGSAATQGLLALVGEYGLSSGGSGLLTLGRPSLLSSTL